MNIAYWIVAILLALGFLGVGVMKLVRPKDTMAAAGMGYVEDFTSGQIKLIGAAEVLGAIGLILPKLLDIAPVLGPIAAIALATLMIGAISVHIRRKEQFVSALVMLVVAIIAAVLGFLALS